MKKIFLYLLFSPQIFFGTDENFVKEIQYQDFKQAVLEQELPVFFQISVNWCLPCKLTKPMFEELSIELKDRASFVTIDVGVEENRELLQLVFSNYHVIIGGFPVIFVFNKGKYIDYFSARAPTKDDLAKAINLFLEEIEKLK